jgi:hypothetical protein
MTTTALQTFVERSDWHRRVSTQQRNSLPFNFLATTTTQPITRIATTQLHSARNRGGLEQRREGATPQGSNALSLFSFNVLARPSMKWLLSRSWIPCLTLSRFVCRRGRYDALRQSWSGWLIFGRLSLCPLCANGIGSQRSRVCVHVAVAAVMTAPRSRFREIPMKSMARG